MTSTSGINNGTAVHVPPSLLLNFLQTATKELEDLTLPTMDDSGFHSRSEIRALLLRRQGACLERVVTEFNNNNNNDSKLTAENIQDELKKALSSQKEGEQQEQDKEILQASEALNEAARLAYCRLVLFSGCLQEASQSSSWPFPLKTSGGMSRQDILELCGLCQTVLRLPLVQDHLSEPGQGKPLFAEQPGLNNSSNDGDDGDDDRESKVVVPHSTLFPQERLERIQRIFLQMIGYDADYGTAEIKRIFYSPDNNHELTRDEKVMQAFTEMMTQIKSSLTQATMKISESNFLSDQAQGGSTRIVAVDYSEHDIDAQTGRVLPKSSSYDDDDEKQAAPIGQAMEEAANVVENEAARQRQEQQLRAAAVAAARLEQEILGQVLSLPEEEREQELEKARQVSEQVVRQAMEIAPGPGRVDFLRSQDADTQRLMALHKLWQRHVMSKAANSNGSNSTSSSQQQQPTIRYAPGFAPE